MRPDGNQYESSPVLSESAPVASAWCHSAAKRAFDFCGSTLLLILLLPLMFVIGIAVKLTSPGPMLFRQRRPGKGGCEFIILKFRTMIDGRRNEGPVLTRAADPRVTKFGGFMRKWKLDELPQLFNVLRGEMSFVGPRPQPTRLWQQPSVQEQAVCVLSVRPGITSQGTVNFRNEEELLAPLSAEEVEEVYMRAIMPLKLNMEIQYLRNATFTGDARIILKTVFRIFHRHQPANDSHITECVRKGTANGAKAELLPTTNKEYLTVVPTSDQPSGTTNEASVRVFKNYAFLASSYAASRFLTFFSLVYVARYVGVQSFGQVNFAYAIFMYSTLLTHLGLMTFGTREVARQPGQIQHQATRILSLRMALTLASFLLLVLFTYLVNLEPQLKILIVLFGLSLFPTAALLDWAFKGVERMNVVGVIEILRAVPYLALVLFWVKQPSHVLRIPIFFLLSTVLAALLGLLLFWRDYGSLWPRVELTFWKRAMRESLPLGLAFMLLQIYYLTDTVALGFLRGDLFVGWYSAAYKSVAFILVLGGLFFETTFPVISRCYKHASEKLPGLLSSSLRVTALFAIPMAVGGTVLAEPFLVSLYGPEYRAATIAFQFLIWGVAIELIGMNWGYALMACDRAKEYMKGMGLGAVISVGLNLALIPKLGLMGAGLARLATSAIISLYFWLQFRRVIRTNWSGHLFKPALASALMVAVMLSVGHFWILRMALGMLVYGGTILLTGTSERTQVLKIVNAILAPSQTTGPQFSSPSTQAFQTAEEARPIQTVEK
jgi:O-antigen/teichoic acid export membrane protein/lipopolysaccharide/colanic/teichoic acid biosynthesis glycosyltransferase